MPPIPTAGRCPLEAVHIELGGLTTSTAAAVALVRFDRYNLPTAP
jgi:hypothetical protein